MKIDESKYFWNEKKAKGKHNLKTASKVLPVYLIIANAIICKCRIALQMVAITDCDCGNCKQPRTPVRGEGCKSDENDGIQEEMKEKPTKCE